jgi:hypothetical protein
MSGWTTDLLDQAGVPQDRRDLPGFSVTKCPETGGTWFTAWGVWGVSRSYYPPRFTEDEILRIHYFALDIDDDPPLVPASERVSP